MATPSRFRFVVRPLVVRRASGSGFLHGHRALFHRRLCRRGGRGRYRFFDNRRARIQKHGHCEKRRKNDKFFHSWNCSFTEPFGTDASTRCVSGEVFSEFNFGQSSRRERNRFVRERWRFDSRMRSFKARGRGLRCRRIFSRRAISAARSAWRRRSSAAVNRSRASFRLTACDLESCTVTVTPVGRWRSVTAVETLLTFCPPGPPERANVSSRSDSRSTEFRAAECFRDRAGTRAPSKPVRSRISPRARHIFHPSTCPAHRRHRAPC